MAKQFRERNVAAQRSDPSSIYQLYRRLSALRRKQRSLALGAYRPLVASGDLLLYVREVADERLPYVAQGGSRQEQGILQISASRCDF